MNYDQMSSSSALSHIAQKHVESSSALLKAASLPYENFCAVANPERVPSPVATPETQLGDAIVMDAQRDPGNYGYIEFYPELASPLYNTRPSNTFFQGAISGRVSWQAVTPDPTVALGSYLGGRDAGRPVTCFQHGTDSKLNVHGSAPNVTFTSTYSGVDRFPGSLSVMLQGFNTGTMLWGDLYATPAVLINGATVSVVGTVMLPAINGLRFVITNTSDSPYGSIDVTLSPTVGTFQADVHWAVCDAIEFPFIRGIPDIQGFRRIAASLLFTYTGSQVLNGGQVACALVPADWAPNYDTPFQAVASLRNDRYDGPIRDGGDVTWRPFQMYDSLPQNRMSVTPVSSKIVFGYRFEAGYPDSSARIRAYSLFGINSPNPIVGRMIWTPCITPEAQEALAHYYQSMPAATSNKLHIDMKAVKSMGNKALKIVQSLLTYDTEIAALLTAMGQPEAALGVKAVGGASRAFNKSKARPNPGQPRPAGDPKPTKRGKAQGKKKK